MKKIIALSALVIIVTLVGITNVLAHSGGTNAYGCHINHTTGDYHCH